ncbi:MAG: NAD(P)-dependent oxidoreductase [Kiritimatiellae bacterium]|nr:NAD(P)-dependent oxidoreductase [Kiritimatiellia bacterium]
MDRICVISGVAGMTGSMTARKLLAGNIDVVGFDNFFCGSRKVVSELSQMPGFHFFEYDINDSRQMDALFDWIANKYPNAEKWFVNCAAVVHTKHFYHPYDTFETNVVAMKDSLERSIGAGCTRYINCSSSEVYSMQSWMEGGVREDSPVLIATAGQSLRTSYATGKLMTEFFMRDATERGRILGCSMRFANVYSPEERFADHIIPHIIDSLQRTGGVTLLENARETRRTFLNNGDSCDAVLALLREPSALDGGIYNVGTTEEIRIVDLVAEIASLMGVSAPRIDFSGVRTADPPRRLLCVDKIRTRAGWQSRVPLEEGLKACIANRLARKGEEA